MVSNSPDYDYKSKKMQNNAAANKVKSSDIKKHKESESNIFALGSDTDAPNLCNAKEPLENNGQDLFEHAKVDKKITSSIIENLKGGDSKNLICTISKYDVSLQDFMDSVFKLPKEDKDNALKDIESVLNEGIKTKNTDNMIYSARFLEKCLNSENKKVKKFVEKFLDSCSDEDILNASKYTDVVISFIAEMPNSKVSEKMQNIIFKDGNLDGEFGSSKQGSIGDCWLLAGLNALNYTESGQKLLNNAFKQTDSGWSVEFKGVNKTLKITNEELFKALKSKEYSQGDSDVVLFELAYEKVLEETFSKENKSKETPDSHEGIDGGNFDEFMYLLKGQKVQKVYNEANIGHNEYGEFNVLMNIMDMPKNNAKNVLFNPLNRVLEEIEKGDYAAVVSFKSIYGEDKYITDIEGRNHLATPINGAHEWSIKNVEGDNVTIVNPWNSDIEVIVSKNELNDNAYGIEYIDLSENK